MRYRALATDYDGTIAAHGTVDDTTTAALQNARASGMRLVLVTGRELSDLAATFPHTSVFDRIVAENGAVLYEPSRQSVRVLASPPPAALIAALQAERIPVSVGHSIIATVEPHEHVLLSAIRDLGLEWHVIFNKGSVMALPSGVNKATGLAQALDELGVAPADTIGVGDAENDHAFIEFCGLGVAVANALPALKSAAGMVTEAPNGAGVRELIAHLLISDREASGSKR